MKRIFWIVVIAAGSYQNLAAQEKFISTHFYANPYLYNPAFAGGEYRPSLFLSYRKQWMGIEEAPTTANLTFHTPIGANLAMGLNVSNDARGVLSATSGLLTFAYMAPFGTDHYLKFGLTGGVVSRSIKNYDELISDPRFQNDEALLNALEKTMTLDGQFGFNYHVKGFNLGVTLPRLFKNELFVDQEFDQGTLDPLNSYQAMIFYQSANKEAPVTFEPYLVYRVQPDKTQQFEGAGIIRIKNAVWLGAAYRQHLGITALGGITINDQMHFGYAYDIASQPVPGFMNGSHEIMLKLNFGEEKRPKKRERTIATQENDPYQEYLNNRRENPIDQVDENPRQNADASGKIANYAGPTTVTAGNHARDLKPGHYVVVGVFNNLQAAERYSAMLFESGYYTKHGYSSDSKYFYVYIYYSPAAAADAEAARDSFGQRSLFPDAWVLTVE